MLEMIGTPAVLVDLDIAEKNISSLVEGLKKYKISYRPHIKTHKSIFLARLQQKMGACGITCAKLGEAEVFAEAGFDDILLAYPVIGDDKCRRLGELLLKGIRVRTVVNSIEGARGLSGMGQNIGRTVEVLLDVDGGMERGGVKPGEPALQLAEAIKALPGVRLVGIEYFDGSVYGAATMDEIAGHITKEKTEILDTACLLRERGFEIRILSGGSSFSAKQPQLLEGLTEARPGNCIFNDCTQLYKQMITEEDCALKVMATVISRVDPFHYIIDAGTKTFSSDTSQEGKGYGYIIGHSGAVLWKMNEEHGYVRFAKPDEVKIGDRLMIIPNHSCQQANLFPRMYGIRKGSFVCEIDTSARGKSV